MDILDLVVTYLKTEVSGNIAMQLLLAAIFMDFLTGMARATTERKWNSTVGINGWIRHGIVVIMTFVVAFFSVHFEAAWFGIAFTLAFAYEYLISILENWSLAGYKIPSGVEVLLDKLPYPAKSEDSGEGIEHDKNDACKLKKVADRFVGEKGDDIEDGTEK